MKLGLQLDNLYTSVHAKRGCHVMSWFRDMLMDRFAHMDGFHENDFFFLVDGLWCKENASKMIKFVC